MDTTQIIVTLVGFGIIGWIVWYFWLWKGESVAARGDALRRRGGAARVRAARSPARRQGSLSRGHAARARRVRVHLRDEHVQGQDRRALNVRPTSPPRAARDVRKCRAC